MFAAEAIAVLPKDAHISVSVPRKWSSVTLGRGALKTEMVVRDLAAIVAEFPYAAEFVTVRA